MIGNVTSGASFQGLGGYLAKEQARVSFTDAYHLLSDGSDAMAVAREMDDIAAGKDRCKKPVYHLSLSWHPEDDPTHAEMRAAAARVLRRLELQEHQALVVGHNDTDHAHVHMMVNRVHYDPERRVWDGWKDGRHVAYRLIEAELRALEQEMGWTVTPGHLAPTPGHDPPDWWRTGSRYRMRFGAEITVRMGPPLQNARSWKELQAVLESSGMHVEARPRGMVITDGSRYIGASRIRGLKGGRPDLEERFGQTLDDFLATGESPEPVPTADWVWKVRVDSLYHARRHFNKTPELYALYKESLAWRAAERARADVERQERRLAWHRSALRRAERAEQQAAHTRQVLLLGLRQLLRGHAGLEAALALAALTAALTKLGLDGVLAVMRQHPDRVGLPPPRKWRKKGDGAAPLESELRAYAFAQAEAPTAGHLAECRRGVDEAEQGLAAARHAHQELARRPDGRWLDGMRARRKALPAEQRAALAAYELGRGRGREVAERGL